MDRYAVIGHPVDHSLSPTIHQSFAQQLGQRLSYERLPAELDGFTDTVNGFFAAGGLGLNVTLPFKEEAAAWVTRLATTASIAGAVNTIVPDAQRPGDYVGHNTDGAGLLFDLQQHLGWSPQRARVALLGAGGAARGVVAPLLASGVRSLHLANRTSERAVALVADVTARLQHAATDPGERLVACRLDELPGNLDLIINATSASLDGQGALIAPELVRGANCYDMLYSNQPTAFCVWAQAVGARAVSDGLGMLIEQAAEAFALWRGQRPDGGELLRDREKLFQPEDK